MKNKQDNLYELCQKHVGLEKALKEYNIKEIIESNLSKLVLVDSIEDYKFFLSRYFRKKKNDSRDRYIFRGMSDITQKYSGITREYFWKRKLSDGDFSKISASYLQTECEYIRHFEQNALNELSDYALPLDLIAAAQHYGIRTRLIDWSQSPLIATLFALHNDSVSCGYYLLFATNQYEHITLYSLPMPQTSINEVGASRTILYEQMLSELMSVYLKCDEKEYENYFSRSLSLSHTKAILEKVDSRYTYKDNIYKEYAKKMLEGKAVFLETNFSNSRIINQRGLFQIPTIPTRRYMDKTINNYDFILINKSIRRQICDYCNYLGFNYYSISPESQSIAKEINSNMSKRHP